MTMTKAEILAALRLQGPQGRQLVKDILRSGGPGIDPEILAAARYLAERMLNERRMMEGVRRDAR
jgi:hypothetical protein